MDTTLHIPKDRRELAAARVQRFVMECLPGKALEVIVRQRKSERSSPQNRYLHGVAYKILADATGYEVEDIAEYLLGTHFGWVTVKCPKTPSNPNGCKDVPRRTTTKNEDGKRDVLKWDAFGDYVAWIQRFAAKKGIHIPDPDPGYADRDDEREAA